MRFNNIENIHSELVIAGESSLGEWRQDNIDVVARLIINKPPVVRGVRTHIGDQIIDFVCCLGITIWGNGNVL